MNRDPRQVLTEWLVLAAQDGSEEALTGLHALWQPDFRRLALARIERPGAVDEVMTDVWLAIVRGLHRLEDPACFPSWAFRIVERRSADWIRQRSLARRRQIAAAAAAEDLGPAACEPADEPDDVHRLRAAIIRLPADQRDLIHFYYDLARSVGEIAEILGVQPGTVKSRLFSIRENLKQMLTGKTP